MSFNRYKTILQTQKGELEGLFGEDEVWNAIKGCGSNKASGLDGFNFGFIKKCWGVIKANLLKALEWFLESCSISKGCNPSFVTLIPKNQNPFGLSDYRPISLIRWFYKIVAKILAERIKKVIGRLIGNEQNAFIKVSRGIFKGVKIGHDDIHVSHLQYVDDTLVFGEWSLPNAKNLMRIFKCIQNVYGLKINHLKTKIYGVVVRTDEIERLAKHIGVSPGFLLFTYLGLSVEAEAFLADVECTAHYDDSLAITTTTTFKVSHEDAYDSDVDEAPQAAAAFMANLTGTSTREGISNDTDFHSEYQSNIEDENIPTDVSTVAREDSCQEELVWLKHANKVVTELLQSYGQPVQTVPMLSKRPTFASKDLHITALGRSNPKYLKTAQLSQPTLYISDVVVNPLHAPIGIEDNLFKEVSEYMKIFDELYKAYDQCVIDKKCLEIENKNLLIQNECLFVESVSKDICSVVLTPDNVVPISVEPCSNCDKEQTRNLELKADISKLQGKDNIIGKLKAHINNMKDVSTCPSLSTIEIENTQLKEELIAVRIKNDSLRDENVSIKARFQELYKSKARSNSSVSSGATIHVKPKAVAFGLYVMTPKYVPPQKRINREAHIPSHRKETVTVVDMTNVPINLPTGIKFVPEARKSKSKNDRKTHKNLPARSQNVKRLEKSLRNLNKKNRVDSSLNVKRSNFTSKSVSVCKTCNECLVFGNHDECVVKFVNAKKPKVINNANVKQVWKATGNVLSSVGFQWKPTGRKFTLGDTCTLTRITKPEVVSLENFGSVRTSEPTNNVTVTPRLQPGQNKKKVKENQEKDKIGSKPNKNGKHLLQNSPVIKLPIQLHPRILPPKGRIRRSSKQKVENYNFEEHLTLVATMTDNRTMGEMLCAPTEGCAEAIVVPLILAEQFELKHSLINMMTSEQFFGLEKDNPHDHIRAARRWLEKEPPCSITTWDDLVSKFINEFFPPHELQTFERYKDLLRACPHHGFTELHQLDTFSNALNPTDQDSLNAAAGGNLLEKSPQDALTIIENKSKHTSDVTTAITAMLKQLQANPPPAQVKAIEEICVTCGGAHPYYQCLATGGNTFPEFRDNIQGYVSAAASNYNQGNPGYRPQCVANQMRPPGFAHPNVQNNQNRFGQPQGFNRGTNFNQEQPYQATAQSNQNFHLNELEKIKRMNDVIMKAMQNQIDMMNTASTSGSGSLPGNTVANPKGELKAITTRSGLVTDGPTVPTHSKSVTPEEDECA
uniref:Transposon TX1 uncharacterized n=1 Tax=Tanacetum cinerariifolium TaxID=118510 RepID=A0A6L2NPG1_TANCI|nr:transposon TX1 uncharacterized [Tanacetum cinerariifolium]